MFEYNSKYLNQGIGTGGTHINQSGAYEMAISEAYLLKMQNTYSEALILELEDLEEKKAKVNIWYKNKNGEKVESQNKHITHLMYLLSNNPKTKKTTLNAEKNREEIQVFKDKIIGVILEFSGTEQYTGNDGNEYTRYNYNLKGFYDVTTKATADEKRNGKETKTYNYWKERFEKENKKIDNKQNRNQQENKNDEDSEDDFPF